MVAILRAIAADAAPGVILGIVILGIFNGIPGVNLHQGSATISRWQDVLTSTLVAAMAIAWALRSRHVGVPPDVRVMYAVSGLLATWWGVTVARSAIFDGVTITRAALYGRDFLYFAIAGPLVCNFLAERRHLVRPLVGTLASGVAVYACGQILSAVSGRPLLWLVHVHQATVLAGTYRIYADMNGVVRLALGFAVGGALLGSSAKARVLSGLFALLCAISVVLQLTRAGYFACGIGLVIGIGLWLSTNRDQRDPHLMARLAKALVVLLVLGLIVLSLSPSAQHVVGVALARGTSGLTDFGNRSGNVGYRLNLMRYLSTLLGGHWLVGLGLLHPASRPIPGLPYGSIRDPDLGVFNILATMGLIGAALLYAPLAIVARIVLRTSVVDRDAGLDWMRLGVLIALATAIAGSPTLGDLFSLSGLISIVVVLALACATVPLASLNDRRVTESPGWDSHKAASVS